jgi:hypothetical protein
MAKYMVERLNQAYTLPEHFIYEHMNGTSRYYLDINGNKPRSACICAAIFPCLRREGIVPVAEAHWELPGYIS